MARTLREIGCGQYRFLPELFDRPMIEETSATCDDCAMCDKGQPRTPGSAFFEPEMKCCTFHPDLPPYAVGAILAEEDGALAEGRTRIRDIVASGVGVTPRGLLAPPKYAILYEKAVDGFGRARSLRCPYYVEGPGGCGIWPFRNSVCSTYFCKYVDGADGLEFWSALKRYLSHAEECLTDWVLYELDLPYTRNTPRRWNEIRALSREDVDGKRPRPEVYEKAWGDWAGREEAYYLKAHEMVGGLDHADLRRIAGVTHDHLLRELERRYDALQRPELPSKLMRNPSMQVWPAGDTICLNTYADTDPVLLPESTYRLLDRFDGGEPHEVVTARIDDELDTRITEDLLLALFRHRVLVDADEVRSRPS